MESLKVTFGLQTGAGKFLTCESLMGGRLSVLGSSLKKKQTWSFVRSDGAYEGVVGFFVSYVCYYVFN